LMFGPEMRNIPLAEVHEAAGAVYERFVLAVAEGQKAGRLPEGDPVELAALLYATSHGAVDLALAGQDKESKGLDDPLALLRLLFVHLRIDR
ncbi:MAG: WHG domain-containing protein, partial [Rubrobacter sp.]